MCFACSFFRTKIICIEQALHRKSAVQNAKIPSETLEEHAENDPGPSQSQGSRYMWEVAHVGDCTARSSSGRCVAICQGRRPSAFSQVRLMRAVPELVTLIKGMAKAGRSAHSSTSFQVYLSLTPLLQQALVTCLQPMQQVRRTL